MHSFERCHVQLVAVASIVHHCDSATASASASLEVTSVTAVTMGLCAVSDRQLQPQHRY